MAREIKFRAWDKESQSMLTGFFLTPLDIIVPHYWKNKKGEVEFMQFTGLKDKNGQDIYEGDIIKSITDYYGNRKERVSEIEWIDDMENDSFGEPMSTGYMIYGGEWEVIGNIYENPELLNSNKKKEQLL